MTGQDAETTELAATEGEAARRKSGRRPLLILGLLGLIAAAACGVGGYLLGQSSRLSDEQIEDRLTEQAEYDRRVYQKEQEAALADLERQLERSFARRVQTETAEASAEGRAEGEAAGYASGQESGFASGKEQGKQEGEAEGYSQGFEEGTCYVPGTYEYIC